MLIFNFFVFFELNLKLVNSSNYLIKKSAIYIYIYWLIKLLCSHEKNSTKDRNKSTVCFTLRNVGVTLSIAVKVGHVSGSTDQVPIEIGSIQGRALVISWLLGASRNVRVEIWLSN